MIRREEREEGGDGGEVWGKTENVERGGGCEGLGNQS